MSVKKLAFFVEGQSEQIFVSQLIVEIAGVRNVSITENKISGGSNVPRNIRIIKSIQQPSARFEVLISDCGNDEKVATEIRNNYLSLKREGYSKIIGLRDLFPLTDLNRLKRGLSVVEKSCSNDIDTEITVAVQEFEAWILAETNHFLNIDASLDCNRINADLGFDPCTDDMRLRPTPASDLNDIYNLIGLGYRKKRSQVERTINNLDFANIYINLRNTVPELGSIINNIDDFLT